MNKQKKGKFRGFKFMNLTRHEGHNNGLRGRNMCTTINSSFFPQKMKARP